MFELSVTCTRDVESIVACCISIWSARTCDYYEFGEHTVTWIWQFDDHTEGRIFQDLVESVIPVGEIAVSYEGTILIH